MWIKTERNSYVNLDHAKQIFIKSDNGKDYFVNVVFNKLSLEYTEYHEVSIATFNDKIEAQKYLDNLMWEYDNTPECII